MGGNMAKRFVDTEIWNKAWYQELSLKEKILVKYIFEQCDCAGVWDINFRLASFIIGESVSFEDIENINKKNLLFEVFNDNKIFVIDFIEFQYGKLSYNCKPHLPVIKLLTKYGLEFETIDENNLTIKQQRKRLTAAAKEKIFIRDKYECQYCGSKEDLEIDHIVPLSKGGNNEDYNLITACHKCNKLKNDKSLKEFINSGCCKNLDRVSKILDTLEEQEQEQEQEQVKEKEKDKEKEIECYGEHFNVVLVKGDYEKLLTTYQSKKLVNDAIEDLGTAIRTGKEQPYRESLPYAHYERLRAFIKFRRDNPKQLRGTVTDRKAQAIYACFGGDNG